MPDAEQHYRDAAGRQYHGVKRSLPPEALPWVARLRAEKFRPFVRPTDTVLEFGVGVGWNLRELPCVRKIGCDVTTFLEADLRSAGIEFHPSIQDLPDALADVLVCHHALEHVLEPAKVLVELTRLLKPGGAFLLHVPLETRRSYRRFDPAEPNHHLYSWNVQTLGALVTECGWRVESAGVGRFGYDRFAGVWALRLKIGERGFRFLRGWMHAARPEREVRIVARRKS